MKVTMIGLGYIGLPTAVLIASKGHQVIGVDVNEKTIQKINQGIVPTVEPDLDGLLKSVIEKGQLRAQKELEASDVFMIAVPTPFKAEHEPDLSYVEAAVRSIVPVLNEGSIVILESTSPVGTTEKVAGIIFQVRPELQGKLAVAYCPERVLPGRILYELENNDRVIGGIDDVSTEKAVSFYAQFVKGNLHQTTSRTAEMCKLSENAYRDTNIAFANELSMICDENGVDVHELISIANKHPRVNILDPGPGVGGHCIAVDPWFLIHEYEENTAMMKTARLVNRRKADWVRAKVMKTAEQWEEDNGRAAKIVCLGITYKPDIDDLRESPAYEISQAIAKEKGHNVIVVEPNVAIEDIPMMSLDDAINWADIIVILVGHYQFKSIEPRENQLLLDMCGGNKLTMTKMLTPKLSYVKE